MWLKEGGRKDRELMNDEIITQILRKMLPYLENEQMKILQEILPLKTPVLQKNSSPCLLFYLFEEITL